MVLGSLSLVYPFSGRVIILPPGVRAAAVVEAVAYALVPTGLVVLVIGRVLLHRAYRTYVGAGEGRRRRGEEATDVPPPLLSSRRRAGVTEEEGTVERAPTHITAAQEAP